VIQRELAHYLIRKKKQFDFKEPEYHLDRVDSDELRMKILNMPYAEWSKMGYSKRDAALHEGESEGK